MVILKINSLSIIPFFPSEKFIIDFPEILAWTVVILVSFTPDFVVPPHPGLL
jgi:hypothetical protein